MLGSQGLCEPVKMSQNGQSFVCNISRTVKACHTDSSHTQWRRVAAEKSVRLRRAYHCAHTLPCRTFRISASEDIEPILSFVERDAGTFTLHFSVAVLHVRQERNCLWPLQSALGSLAIYISHLFISQEDNCRDRILVCQCRGDHCRPARQCGRP